MADEYHTAPARHLVNFHDLNRILRAEIFLHRDGQLRAAHVILGYKASTKRFQSPKNVIKARDPRLARINVAIPGFLQAGPPPEGTQDAELPAPLAAQLLYAQEPPLPSDEEAEGSTSTSVQEVTEEDFEVFNRPDAPSASTARSSSSAMGFQEKTPDLLALLSAHAGGSSSATAVPPRLPTPPAPRTSPTDAAEKKRKRGPSGKEAITPEDGEIT